MKRALPFILALLMLLQVLAACSSEADQTSTTARTSTTDAAGETGTSETSTTETVSPVTTTDPTQESEYVDDYVDTDIGGELPPVVEHVMLEEVPSSFSLVGTKHLPPIDNQGGIGSCASEGITYMQFTNAVSRYIESKGIDSSWNPSSGDEQYIFAPKFTYNYAGAGTAWVYEVLKDHGCLTLDRCQFYGHDSYKYGTSKNNRQPQTLSWSVDEGEMERALDYRVSSYEQIWSNTLGNQLTDNEAGQALLFKIKDAIVQGNVVVTGGFSSDWQYAQVTASDSQAGTGTKGEYACVWCNGTSGGHQVSIVGYDDNFVCSFNGVQLKGAFLVANSWGANWKNKGYFWVMYDSLNKVSEYPELNALEGRVNAMDQYCFIYWEKDIVLGKPDAYVTVEVSIANREGFYIELTKTDVTDVCTPYVTSIFNFGGNFQNTRGVRDALNGDEGYLTFSGNVDTEAEKGYITLGYQGLFAPNTGFDDYLWGVNVYSADSSVTIHKITLHDATGAVRAEIVPNEESNMIKIGGKCGFVFDLNKSLSTDRNEGSFKLKNTASDLYITPYYLALNSGNDVDKAAQFDMKYDIYNRYYVITLDNSEFLLDIKGTVIEDGKAVQFNKYSNRRNTQAWKVVKRDDGTYNIRLAADTRYALGMIDGMIVLVSGKDILDYGTWIFEKAGNSDMIATVRYNEEGKLICSGRLSAGKSMNVNIYSSDGAFIRTFVVTGNEEGGFAEEVTGLVKGNYLFTFTSDKGAILSTSYYLAVGS